MAAISKYKQLAQRLLALLRHGPRLAVLGSTDFWYAVSERPCGKAGRFLAALPSLVLLTVGLAVADVSMSAPPKEEPKLQTTPRRSQRTEPPGPQSVETPRTDLYGDPLPRGAVARLGTVRFRHEGEAGNLAFSPDGKILVGDTGSGGIVWDATTGKELHRLPGHSLTLSRDGTILAALSGGPPDGSYKVSLREMPSAKQLREFTLPDKEGQFGPTIRFAPDGKSFAVFDGETTSVEVVELASGKVKASFKTNQTAIEAIAFSPDSKMLALGTSKPSVQLWDIAAGKMIRGIEAPKDSFAGAVAFSPDGKTVAWGTWDLVILSDVATGKELIRLVTTMEAIIGLAFTPDGKTLVSGSQDGKIRVWDIATTKIRFTLDSRMGVGRSMALSADGKTVAIATAGQSVRLWNVMTGKELVPELQGHDSQVNCLIFSPNGKTLVSGGNYQQIHLWDTATWKHSRLFQNNGSAQTLSFSPDGKRLASVAYNKKVHIWDVAAGRDALTITVPETEQANSAVFSADGRKLFTFDRKRNQKREWEPYRLRRWDAVTGKQEDLWTLPQKADPVLLGPNDQTLALAETNSIRLYDVKSHRERLLLGHKDDWVQVLAFSPDGRVLASGAWVRNFTVRLWEVATGKEIFLLKGHNSSVSALAWSPDGRLLASGDQHYYPEEKKAVRTIRLWDAASGTELARFGGYDSNVRCLAFSPDGSYLAAGFTDSTILIWEVGKRTPKVVPQTMGEKELETRWADLAGEDAGKAQLACWRLIVAPQQSVPLLRDRLKPAVVVDAGQIQKWIAELNHDEFAVREAATKELEKLGGQAEAPIEKALQEKVPPETRRRLELISKTLDDITEPNTVRTVRAIMVLEHIGTPEARDQLKRLAGGAAGARQTREAQSALSHLQAKE